MATPKNTRKIKITIYTELKPSDTLRVVSEDNITLVLYNGKSVGTEAYITNINGRTYLVWTKIN